MAKVNPLSLDFLTRKPGRAAGVLQTLEPEAAALYLLNIPVRVLTPVVAAMQAWSAAKILEHMPAEKGAALLGQLDYPTAVAIVRLAAPASRAPLLELLPGKLRRNLNRSLSFPELTVGAWMDSSSPCFSQLLTAAECLEALRRAGRPCDSVVAVDDNHCIVGVVPLSALVLGSGNPVLGSLADRSCAPLSAQLSLPEARKSPGWSNYTALPVRNAANVYMGTLSRQALNSALQKLTSDHEVVADSSLFSHLAQAMLATAAGLLGSAPEQTAAADAAESPR